MYVPLHFVFSYVQYLLQSSSKLNNWSQILAVFSYVYSLDNFFIYTKIADVESLTVDPLLITVRI